MARNHALKQRGSGQQEPACSKRWDGVPCRPINRYWIFTGKGQLVDVRHTCACGKRFKVANLQSGYARSFLERRDGGNAPARGEPPSAAELWDEGLVTAFGKIGVVPVGTAVLHSPTRWFTGEMNELGELAARMERTMEAAGGIGLAANQVGADVRVIAHGIPECAPAILVNPVRVDASGAAERSEGCLSLNVPLAHGRVARWRTITVVADLLDGRTVVLQADEMLAKVLQHELDHLDGIEYVQRMHGAVSRDAYGALESASVPLDWLPLIGPEVDPEGATIY